MTDKILPGITVIMPVKNSESKIEKAILSLVNQKYPNLEFIILDAESNDGTIEIIKKYEKYIDYWHSKRDKGAGHAAHIGVNMAKHEIVGFLNADDFYSESENVLMKVGREFGKDENLDIVSFLYKVIDEDGNEISASRVEDMNFKKDKALTHLGVNARFFKKDLFIKNELPIFCKDGGKILISNDFDYMTRFTIMGVHNKTLNFTGYNYLSHEGSLTFNKDLENSVRLTEDEIYVSQKILSEQNQRPLSKYWQKRFKKLIKKGRASLVKDNLRLNNYGKAFDNFCLGLKSKDRVSFILTLLKKFAKR